VRATLAPRYGRDNPDYIDVSASRD